MQNITHSCRKKTKLSPIKKAEMILKPARVYKYDQMPLL